MSRKSPFSAGLAVECLEGRAMPAGMLATDPLAGWSGPVLNPAGTFSLTFNGQTTPAATGGSQNVYTITFGGSLVGAPLASVTDLLIDPFNPAPAGPTGKELDVESWSWGEGK